MSVPRKDRVGMMMYHVDVARIGPWEMKRFINRKYCNGYVIYLNHEIGQTIFQCQLAMENGDAVWLSTYLFDSKKETIEQFMEKIDGWMQKLKDAGVYDAVVGFHWDEPILNKQTNEDFYTVTKALTEKYGLRIFPVFSTHEITGYKGNDEDKLGEIQFEKWASEYITDIGFDSYGQDVRPEYQEAMQGRLAVLREKYPEIHTGDDYYRFYTRKLKELMLGEPNIWYYPCAYLYNTWAGQKSDEDYCIAHLEYFVNLLKEQEHPGGLHIYNWKTWYDYRPALDYYLDQDTPERWDRYEKALQKACEELSELKINPYKK